MILHLTAIISGPVRTSNSLFSPPLAVFSQHTGAVTVSTSKQVTAATPTCPNRRIPYHPRYPSLYHSLTYTLPRPILPPTHSARPPSPKQTTPLRRSRFTYYTSNTAPIAQDPLPASCPHPFRPGCPPARFRQRSFHLGLLAGNQETGGAGRQAVGLATAVDEDRDPSSLFWQWDWGD